MNRKIFSQSEVDEVFKKIAPFGQFLESFPVQFRKVTEQTLSYHCDKLEEIENKRVLHLFPAILAVQRIKKETGDLKTAGLFFRANECVKASIILAYGGYYNSALLLLRSVIELGCYIIYFEKHPVEYLWWKEKKDMKYLSFNDLVENYLFHLPLFEELFTSKKKDGRGENILKNEIKAIYRDISLIIHGRWKSDRNILMFNYDEGQFQQWYSDFLKTMDIFNILIFVEYNSNFEKEQSEGIISSISNESLRVILMNKFGEISP